MDDNETYIGAMSGTSLDGVDAVLAKLSAPGEQLPVLCGSVHHDFDDALRQRLLALCAGQPVTLRELGEVEQLVTGAYAKAVAALLLQTGTPAASVRAIGAHGQTVHHQPSGAERFTMQLLDPNRLAVATGIAVVADFRRRDMALGGQGAPLAPGFHDVALRHATRTRVVLNAGGIANISLLVPGQPCIGFDTGPANILMDAWIGVQRGERFDREGAWAAKGRVHDALLALCMADPYFAQPAPKSTGREHFHLAWLQGRLSQLPGPTPSDEDVQRTLLELSARTVADAVQTACANLAAPPGDLLVCGGGAFNPQLLQRLAARLTSWSVDSTAAQGIPPDAMEALAFAVFSQRTVHGLPGNLPSVTGASQPCVLGALYGH